ncbi:triphosphoribosyl-dephospho-CoA synthase CitG [Clostridium sp. YIM B02515]|uniref:Probable 2-(5''-triphosphoribosyl)-3'-dephosphocoenzyme-A synthase n=1 Tax=Clostridium rhizosphaerae TaxID=2803861 RepID=A0ABS1TFS5_9CLOT|nr:triphosphoribosyl-dephospho-CoA synthase CitG [Clostridium rhizosphaerae]MBL4938221.1 triphosphoribosyl-dephospho-CoA synthase CitG [Clostridium rhizosphaerae]
MKTKEEFAHYVAALAQRAVLYEVSTTPKPGLVDRDDSGAHKDMDFFTFMASSSALYKGLYECVLEGAYFQGEESTELMDRIRIPGIECEKAMFVATEGINTHKGIIFSMGILCTAVGRLYEREGKENFSIEQVLEEVKKVANGLTDKDFKGVEKKTVLTHGESLYKKYGFKGIRGEVESGFSSVQKNAIRVFREWRNKKELSKNELFLDILLNIMSNSEDTNIITRGGIESLYYVMKISKQFIMSGGMHQVNAVEKLQNMNLDFINRNISPGGSADLLAVTIFLGLIEGIIR